MKVLIYEDNHKLRQSLELMIDGTEGMSVVGAFESCSQVIENIRTLKPEAVLMDINMPGVDGIEGVRLIREQSADILILMHTVFEDDEKIFASLSAGANGYLLKKTAPAQLLTAIQDVFTGGAPMSPGVARRVLQSFRNPAKKNEYNLTERENQVLVLLVKGYTYKLIASECHIALDTVRTHLRRIYEKLHVNCGTEAVAKALRDKIVD